MRGATLIYPVHNRANYMIRTLRGLCDFDVDWSESEVLVVDDASTDGLREKCEAFSDRLNIRVMDYDSAKHPKAGANSHPFTPVASINEAARQAGTEQVILSCPEITPLAVNRPDALQRFINYPMKPRQAVFGMVFDQSVQGLISKLVHPTGYWPFFFFGKIRKSEWFELGGYSEDYLPYVSCADAELDVVMGRRGWTYMFLAEPVLLHRFHGRSDFTELPEKSKAAEKFFLERNFSETVAA